MAEDEKEDEDGVAISLWTIRSYGEQGFYQQTRGQLNSAGSWI